MACRYDQQERPRIEQICQKNRLVATTMLDVCRDQAAIAELEPLLVEYDLIIERDVEQEEGCPLLLAALLNNLSIAYQREHRQADLDILRERVEREAGYLSQHGLLRH